MPKRVYAGKWPRVRLAILERDGWLCQIRGKGCTTQATEVDHIVEVSRGGDWYEPTNLRAACHTCNQARLGAMRSQRWMAAITSITLVTGPPSADLLAYVRLHCQPTDLIVDHHALMLSCGHDGRAAKVAYSALVEQLRRGALPTPRAWITSHHPDAATMYPHHRVSSVGDPSVGGSTEGGIQDDAGWFAIRAGHSLTATTARAW